MKIIAAAMRASRRTRVHSRAALTAMLTGMSLAFLAAGVHADPDSPLWRRETVEYKKVGGVALSLHLYSPADAHPGNRRPAIVFFFGGGWSSGSADQFAGQAAYLASRGMVALCAEYRVKSRHDVSPYECIADAKSAMRAVRSRAAEFGIDPDRIAASGGSAGGHLAACMAMVPGFDDPADDTSVSPAPAALVLFNPALDTTGEKVSRLFGDRAAQASPSHFVATGVPPTIIFHGTDDRLIPIDIVRSFDAAMKTKGNRCEVVEFPGEGHGFFNLRGDPEDTTTAYYKTLQATDEFLASVGFLAGKPDTELMIRTSHAHRKEGAKPNAAARPNVLFLFADDQRPDTIAAWGNEHIRTPNLDRLVRDGFGFRRNYCMGSYHGAVCAPSRAMLMSGRTLYHVPENMDGAEIMPEVFRAAGYATFGTGKWHNGRESFARGFERGDAVFFGGMSDHLRVPLTDLKDGKFSAKREGEGFSSELFADAAIGFLKEHDGKAPFFAYVAFSAPHDPRQPPIPFRESYYTDPPPLPPDFMPVHPFHNGWMTGRDEALAPWPRTADVIRDQLSEYYGMITHMDEQIGRILAALDASGRAEETLIVFAADHGLAMGSHGLLGKQNLYEQSMGCPLIFAGPGVPHGSTEALTYLLDIFPTLCELAGVAAPEGIDGRSLASVLRGEASGVRETLYTTYEEGQRALTDGRWKLIRYPKINFTQLFDLETDPHELNNLAGDARHAGRIEAMMTELARWQKRAGDTAPLSVEKADSTEFDFRSVRRKPDAHQPDWIVEKYFPETATQSAAR